MKILAKPRKVFAQVKNLKVLPVIYSTEYHQEPPGDTSVICAKFVFRLETSHKIQKKTDEERNIPAM